MRDLVRICTAAVVLVAGVVVAPAGATHSPGLMQHLSTGPTGGNGAVDALFRGSSKDGTRVFVETTEALVSTDTDAQFDLYERTGVTTSLVSTGPAGGNGAFDESFAGNSANGTRVWFTTREALDITDTDSAIDIYQRSAGATTLISAGAVNGNGAFDVTFRGASDDGTRVFFQTRESLVSGDTDDCDPSAAVVRCRDVYERSGGTTTLVSTGSINGNGAFHASFADASADGTRVLFDTGEALAMGDGDSAVDLYERQSGGTTRISTGSAGGNGALDAFYAGASADGTRVFVHTQEALEAGDSDDCDPTVAVVGCFDVYERTGGATTLVSTGANGAFDSLLAGTSLDGTHSFFQTEQSLAAGDIDAQTDVYDRSGGTTTLVSTGPTSGVGTFPASFRGASTDGAGVFFETNEPLTAADTDIQSDVYERRAGVTTLLSIGADGGNGPAPASFDGASEDGARVFFHTDESLAAADGDTFSDVYEAVGGTSALVSVGPAGGNGNFFADFFGASADGTRVFLHTDEALMTSDTDAAQDVYVARAGAGYARPISATPLYLPLSIAYEACSAPTKVHVSSLPGGSCAPAMPTSQSVTVGTADSNMALTNFAGAVRMTVCPVADCLAPDFRIVANMTDLRCQAGVTSCGSVNTRDGPDYTGQLQVRLSFRLTDKSNGPTGTESATVSSAVTLFPTVPCSATSSDASIGAACSVTTRANALMAGTIPADKRMILEMDQLQVFDGGTDGLVSTAPNTLFAVQGVFAP